MMQSWINGPATDGIDGKLKTVNILLKTNIPSFHPSIIPFPGKIRKSQKIYIFSLGCKNYETLNYTRNSVFIDANLRLCCAGSRIYRTIFNTIDTPSLSSRIEGAYVFEIYFNFKSTLIIASTPRAMRVFSVQVG